MSIRQVDIEEKKEWEREMVLEKTHKTITLPDDLIEWVNIQVEKRRFASVSHATEFALRLLKEFDTAKISRHEITSFIQKKTNE